MNKSRCIIVIGIISFCVGILTIFIMNKTYYLDYEYTSADDRVVPIKKIEFTSHINIDFASEKDALGVSFILNKSEIERVINCLKRIPMIEIPKEEFLKHNTKTAGIYFYDAYGKMLWWITINGGKYVQRSTDYKTFKVKDSNVDIIKELENL